MNESARERRRLEWLALSTDERGRERRKARHKRYKARKRERSLAATQAALETLCQTFPACFSTNNKRPLKIGIHKDVIDLIGPAEDEKLLSKAIALYTADLDYRATLLLDAARINLAGRATGKVSLEHAEHAGKKLLDAGRIEQAAAIARSMRENREIAA